MERDHLSEMISRKLSIGEISREVGKSKASVRHWLAKYDLKTKRLQFNKCPPPREAKVGACELCSNPYVRGRSRSARFCPSCQTKIRRIRRRLAAIAHLGGKCKLCGHQGHPSTFDFHHRDPSTKLFEIGKELSKPWMVLVAELDKCDLLCRNCHAVEHSTQGDKAAIEAMLSYGTLCPDMKEAPLYRWPLI